MVQGVCALDRVGSTGVPLLSRYCNLITKVLCGGSVSSGT